MSLKERFKNEIYEVNKVLDLFRKLFPETRINYYEGNHENRYERYLVDKAPDLFDFHTMPELLKLEERNINWIKYGYDQLGRCLGSNYFLRHEPFNQGKNCASSTLYNAKGVSLGFGHTHRNQIYRVRNAEGNEICARSLGWIGDQNSPIIKFLKSPHEWTQGAEYITYVDRKETYKEYIEIINGKARVDNHILVGKNE